jgi:hypothetical protein
VDEREVVIDTENSQKILKPIIYETEKSYPEPDPCDVRVLRNGICGPGGDSRQLYQSGF